MSDSDFHAAENANPNQSSDSAPTEDVPKKKRIPTWAKVTIVIGLLIVAGLIGGAYWGTQQLKDVDKTSERAIAAIRANDSAALYNLYAVETKQTTSQGDVDALVSRLTPAAQGSSTIVNRSVATTEDGNIKATLDYKLNNGQSNHYIRVTSVRDSGWRITAIDDSTTPFTDNTKSR